MSLPYFNMFPADFEADTSHLSLAEDGAYNRLIRLMWMTPSCTLPDDNAWIKRRMRANDEEFETVVLVVIDEFFTRKDGRISNARLTKEFIKSNELHTKRKNAGKLGGNSKSLKSKDNDSSKASDLLKQPKPKPKPKPLLKAKALSVDEVLPEDPVLKAIEIWKEETQGSDLPQPTSRPSKKRAASIGARLNERSLEEWRIACQKVAASDFCNGVGGRGWRADIDFLSQQNSLEKVLDGKFDNRTPKVSQPQSPATPKTQSEALQAAMRELHEKSAKPVHVGNIGPGNSVAIDATSEEPRRLASC